MKTWTKGAPIRGPRFSLLLLLAYVLLALIGFWDRLNGPQKSGALLLGAAFGWDAYRALR